METEKDAAYWKAQEAALRFLDYKLRTEEEVRRKLLEKGFASDTCEQVLEFLKNYGYINDDAYCGAYIRDSMRFNPKGLHRLRMELLKRGVAKQIAEKALAETDLGEEDAAYGLLLKKIKHPDDLNPKEKQRIISFLKRQGYTWQVIQAAFDRFEES